jgi:hypothetical protein
MSSFVISQGLPEITRKKSGWRSEAGGWSYADDDINQYFG